MILSTVVLAVLSLTTANRTETTLKLFKNLYTQCATKTETLKCLKIQGLKVLDRALHSNAITIVDGITLVGDSRQSRHLKPLNQTKLEKLSSEEIDHLMVGTTARFLDSHKVQIKVPRLVEEARKKRKGGGSAALLWALAIKGSFLAMAYKGIAVMSGTSLIVGKIALLLSAILGLKNLVSSGHEKTTIEIVKVPKYSESHTHSGSYEDESYFHDDHFRHSHHQRSFDSGEAFGRRIGHKRV
ncbi:hypothetical protein GEV33_010109 [Tenebrio molitor]|jgi:hypothetical protein|uniref:Osiris 11 n=1 Tax=Tenebrio molitor TaxID=7067 RepID=A0A8J6HE17_TENMO|nr:hypothetical protein GEV33_010109 [Tenebrio molitor]